MQDTNQTPLLTEGTPNYEGLRHELFTKIAKLHTERKSECLFKIIEEVEKIIEREKKAAWDKAINGYHDDIKEGFRNDDVLEFRSKWGPH